MIQHAAQLQNAADLQPDTLGLQELIIAIIVRDHDGDPVALLDVKRLRNAATQDDLLFTRRKGRPSIVSDKLRKRA